MSAPPVDAPIVLFDGICVLCNSFVNFILKRDSNKRLRFASLQSNAGQALLQELGLKTEVFDSLVLVQGRQYDTSSTAVLKIFRNLEGVWPLAYSLIVIPKPIRDYCYRKVAANRYRWFGKRDRCMVPTSDVMSRFLN